MRVRIICETAKSGDVEVEERVVLQSSTSRDAEMAELGCALAAAIQKILGAYGIEGPMPEEKEDTAE